MKLNANNAVEVQICISNENFNTITIANINNIWTNEIFSLEKQANKLIYYIYL